ncbi:uncharacterized protein METZ01_LOCUS513976, partial [marine metagenome]
FSVGIPYPQNDAWYLSLHSVVGIHFRWDAGSGDYGYWYINDNQNMEWGNGSTHDIAITWKDWDNDGLLEYKFIIDGVAIDSDHSEHTDPSNTIDLTAQEFYIGAINENGAQSLTGGMIENVQVSNIALNETNIGSIGNVASYNFNEGSGSILTDTAGGGSYEYCDANVPDGWAENTDDEDDNCFSNEYDCTNECTDTGISVIDSCGECDDDPNTDCLDVVIDLEHETNL